MHFNNNYLIIGGIKADSAQDANNWIVHQNNGPGSYMVSSCTDSEIVSKILSARFKYLNNYRKGTCSLTFLKKKQASNKFTEFCNSRLLDAGEVIHTIPLADG